MLARLDYIKYVPDVIVDAGSGTGYSTRKLLDRYPAAKMLAIDIAMSMHLQARPPASWVKRLLGTRGNQTCYVAGDIESMPFKGGCAGLVWSNLALQWCNDLKHAIVEAHRILQVNGLFMFSTFGPDTLRELRHAFQGVDHFTHVNRFTDMHDIGDMLVHSGFATPVMDMEYITLTYDDVMNVMHDLKSIGARNATEGRRRSLTGKKGWQNAINRYEALRNDGKLPATFEVVYGHAWKPEPKTPIITPELRRALGLI